MVSESISSQLHKHCNCNGRLSLFVQFHRYPRFNLSLCHLRQAHSKKEEEEEEEEDPRSFASCNVQNMCGGKKNLMPFNSLTVFFLPFCFLFDLGSGYCLLFDKNAFLYQKEAACLEIRLQFEFFIFYQCICVFIFRQNVSYLECSKS